MELKRIRCTSCGADFDNVTLEAGMKYFKCSRPGCGAVFMADQGQAFADRDEEEARKIAEYRAQLRHYMKPFRDEQVRFYCGQILAMIPDDFRATALLVLTEFRDDLNKPVYDFLDHGRAGTPQELQEVFPALLQYGDYRTLALLRDKTIPRCIQDPEELEALRRQVEERIGYLKHENDLYAEVPRDVFICHSSMHVNLAMKAVDALEKDGNTCWISGRNLRPDLYQYWPAIEEAIARCRIFLVVCTEAAMLSKDVQREIKLARKYRLARLELKCDEASHTTLFKDFFDGYSWIKADPDQMEPALEELKRKVYELKTAAQPEEVRPWETVPAQGNISSVPQENPQAGDPEEAGPEERRAETAAVQAESTAEAPAASAEVPELSSVQSCSEAPPVQAEAPVSGLTALQSGAAKETAASGITQEAQPAAGTVNSEEETEKEKRLREIEKELEEERKRNEEERNSRRREAKERAETEQYEKSQRNQRTLSLVFWGLAVLLYAGRIFLTGLDMTMVKAYCADQLLIPGLAYLTAALINVRILLVKTVRPHPFIAFLQLMPLLADSFYLWSTISPVNAFPTLTCVRVTALALAIIFGISSRKHPAEG